MIRKSMKQFLTTVALAAVAATSAFGEATKGNLHFIGRSLADDNAREVIGISNAFNDDCCDGGWHGAFNVTGQYQRSFRDDKEDGLGSRWSVNGKNKMSIGNNTVAKGNGKFDIDARQLGFGNSTDASVTLEPKLYQAGANVQLYLGQDAKECGFFMQASAPIGVAAVDPQLKEAGTIATDLIAGTFDNSVTGGTTAPTITTAPVTSVKEAFAGTASAVGAWKPLEKGKINGKQTTGAKFGDLAFDLGYNFMANEDGHLGVAVRVTAPTGNQTTGEYLMEPVFGNGAGWGLGGKVIGHYDLWHGDKDNKLAMWVDVQATHLFKKESMRTFGLTKNGALSQYLLVADYNDDKNQNSIQNLANVSTLATEVSVGAIVDGAVAFQYNSGNWNMGLGYNFFGRTDEKLEITGDFDEARYGILGNQTNTSASANAPLDSGQPDATINGIMNNAAAAATATNLTTPANRIANKDAFDKDSAKQAAGWSSKVFGNIEYRWNEADYCPYLGVIGSGEFSHSDNNALNQWSVGVQGGISF